MTAHTTQSLSTIFDRLDPAAASEAVIITPAGAEPPATVGVLAGSFDPLTNAHLALAQAALAAGACAAVYLALSKHTVDKEARVRPSDAERALLLHQVAQRTPGLGVLAFNRGLYAEQAVAARTIFPSAAVRFIVGFDKARQIFDHRYYQDREAALLQLFAHVTLLVAPRGEARTGEVTDLLATPANQPYRAGVRALPVAATYAADSATRVREAVQAGAPYASMVPPETVAFIERLHAYRARA